MNTGNVKEVISKAISVLNFHADIVGDIYRIIGLVQENQDFFDDPQAGRSCVELAADKLEELIKEHREKTTQAT